MAHLRFALIEQVVASPWVQELKDRNERFPGVNAHH
jgi:hypothetical protein